MTTVFARKMTRFVGKLSVRTYVRAIADNNWTFYRVYVIKVKATSKLKLIWSSHNIATLALAFDIGLRTLDLRIWGLVWPTRGICTLLVPGIICNVHIKGPFEINIITIDFNRYFRWKISSREPIFAILGQFAKINFREICQKSSFKEVNSRNI